MNEEYALFIDGRWIGSAERETRPVLNPATEEVIGELPIATVDDVDVALTAADRGFKQWSTIPAVERAKVLKNAAKLLTERSDEFAHRISAEQGKPITEAVWEVTASASFLEWYAEECRRTYGRIVPSPDANVELKVVKEPIGPAALFTPWNFPLAELVAHLSAALASGCSVIAKPAEETPGAGILLMQVLRDAGIPDGVVNLVYGHPDEISEQLIASSVIRKVCFTGSVTVGKKLATRSAAAMKSYVMELGGNAPVIVMDDVDVNWVVSVISARKIRNSGQVCTAPNRFFVHSRIYDTFVREYVSTMKAVRVGPGLDPSSQMGALAHDRRLAAMIELVEDAVCHGAKVACGGKAAANKGYFWQPTVLVDVDREVRVAREEIFGPISPIFPFDDLNDALKWANDVPVGLSSYVFTHNRDTMAIASNVLNTGTVSINHGQAYYTEAPFGGMKDSGVGRIGSVEGLDAYFVPKLISTRVPKKLLS